MANKKSSRYFTTLFLLVFVAIGTSCNRGYGCPTNFSMGDVMQMIQQLTQLF